MDKRETRQGYMDGNGKRKMGDHIENKEPKGGLKADRIRELYGSKFLDRDNMDDGKPKKDQKAVKMPEGFWEWEGASVGQNKRNKDERIQHTTEVKQEEYEVWIGQAIEELVGFMEMEKWGELEKKLDEVLDKIQNMAFMEGYLYAITMLQDGIISR